MWLVRFWRFRFRYDATSCRRLQGGSTVAACPAKPLLRTHGRALGFLRRHIPGTTLPVTTTDAKSQASSAKATKSAPASSSTATPLPAPPPPTSRVFSSKTPTISCRTAPETSPADGSMASTTAGNSLANDLGNPPVFLFFISCFTTNGRSVQSLGNGRCCINAANARSPHSLSGFISDNNFKAAHDLIRIPIPPPPLPPPDNSPSQWLPDDQFRVALDAPSQPARRHRSRPRSRRLLMVVRRFRRNRQFRPHRSHPHRPSLSQPPLLPHPS